MVSTPAVAAAADFTQISEQPSASRGDVILDRGVGSAMSGVNLLQRINALATPEVRAEVEFFDLANQWKQETIFDSSIDRIIAHPAYQRIIAMGTSAIPLILHDLEEAPNFWFWALSAITGEDPEPSGFQGDVSAMTRAWLRWGQERGYLSTDAG